MRIKLERWPWQNQPKHWAYDSEKKFGWKVKSPLGRFGGGWHYKLGFVSDGKSVLIIDLLFGSIQICFKSKK